jgi:Mg2+ and Co2+ transporter CorA
VNTPKKEPARLRLKLFDADGGDCEIAEEDIDLDALTDRMLLWVDLEDNHGDDTREILGRLLEELRLGDGREALLSLDGKPTLQNYRDWFLVYAVAVESKRKLQFEGRGLAIACADNLVLTVHRGPLSFLDELHEREHGESRIGSLRAERFTASLLDWHVDSYLHAVSELEAEVDRLEVSMLSSRVHHDFLPELAGLRRGASRLRRLLSPHRHVFGALARPDFRPDDDAGAEEQYRTLEQRFERAMDAVEMGRELVVGSFELFTTRSAQRTNDIMGVLTFVTVLLGSLALVAGAMGMNFKAPIFDTGQAGFWTTVLGMGAISVVAVVVARWRKWM